MLGLNSLNRLVVDDKWKPSSYDYMIHYFMEHGIGFEQFIEYPIPYIVSIISTQKYLVEEQEKEQEKLNR